MPIARNQDPFSTVLSAFGGRAPTIFPRVFAVEPIRESGGYHNQYRNAVYAIALSLPSYYAQMRTSVESALTMKMQELLYETIYYALGDGLTTDGDVLMPMTAPELERFRQRQPYPGAAATAVENSLRPMLPESEINKIAYDTSLGMRDLMMKVVDRILPADLSKMANQRVAKRTELRLSAGDAGNEV